MRHGVILLHRGRCVLHYGLMFHGCMRHSGRRRRQRSRSRGNGYNGYNRCDSNNFHEILLSSTDGPEP
jgi:hypothetical protein